MPDSNKYKHHWDLFDDEVLYNEDYLKKVVPHDLLSAKGQEKHQVLQDIINDKVGSMVGLKWQPITERQTAGMYDYPDNTVYLTQFNTNAPDNFERTTNHEILHSLVGDKDTPMSAQDQRALLLSPKLKNLIKKYNINERYPTVSFAGKMEEALASAYADYAAGKLDDKDLSEGMKQIFKRIDAGEFVSEEPF